MDVQSISMEDIHVDAGFNCRESIAATTCFDLAKNIHEKGLMQPIVVCRSTEKQLADTGKPYQLIAGFRRWTACKSLSWQEIPCSIVATITREEALALNLSENIHRKEISYWEEALAIKKLHDCNMSRTQIANAINMPPGWVQRRQNVLELPAEAQELVRLGILSTAHVSELFKYQKQDEMLEEVKRIRTQHQLSPGSKIVVGKPKVAKRNQAVIKKARKSEDMVDLMAYMRHCGVKQQLAYRVCAWATGTITDYELCCDIKKELEADGIAFEFPSNGIPNDLARLTGRQ